MKFVCLQENLKASLNLAQNIIGRNLTLPILNNLLLETESGRLKISSTNLEIGINTWTSGKVEKEGSITCPAKIIAGFINNLPNKKIELEVRGDTLNIRCENYRASLRGLSAEDFPIIPKIKEAAIAEMSTQALKDGLLQVVGSASLSESRPEITGILFSFKQNELKLVATDSFRLAEKIIFDAGKKNKEEISFIIPQRTVQELIRMLTDREGKVKICLGSNQILFDAEDAQLISRIIDGQYPDYRQIIPQKFETQAILNKDELVNTIRIAGLFSSRVNEIKISVQKDKVEILSKDPDLGENKSQLQAETIGKAVDIKFNYRYLLEGLGNISSKQVFLGLNSDETAGVIKPVGTEDFIYLVMPIKAA